MDVALFDYKLDEKRIAQTPLKERATAKMLVVDKQAKTFVDDHFFNIAKYLKKGDVLVRNNTKVIPARLQGIKPETGAKVEVLLLKPLGLNIYECMVGNAKVIKENTHIVFQDDLLEAVCLKVRAEGLRDLEFIVHHGTLMEALDQIGEMPLPPYIHEKLEIKDRYQTVYAKVLGSAAAPTAGFHFTKEIEAQLCEMGVEILELTLHVGLGTFRPMKVANTDDHVMHYESYEIPASVADALNQAKAEKRRIIAIGTTSLRALETNFQKHQKFRAEREETNLFIVPGYNVQSIDGLLTNFHLPKSTLLMLVSALITREFCLQLYQHAIEHEYRFFSFGDTMLIL